MANIWQVLAVAAVVLYVVHELHNIFMKNKKKFPPGPRGFPIIGNLHMIGKNLHQDLHQLAKHHGPIMSLRFGLVPIVVASSPHAAEQFLKTHDLVFASRPHNAAAQYIAYNQRNLTFGKYGPYWRNMRKLCSLELLSNHKINSFQSMRKQELGIFVNLLKQAAFNHAEVDLTAKLASLSANMACLMVFGKKYMDEEFDESGFKNIIQETLVLTATQNIGELFPFLSVFDLQGFNRRMKELAKIFDEFFEKVIDEHVQSKEQKQAKDIVDTMMTIMQSGDSEFEFDRRHVKAMLLDLLLASMDTSSTAIDWVFSELLKHPKVMKTLQNELELVIGTDRMVEESDLEKLEYLDMVIKEGFRLHPVGPLLIPHESMEDCVVDGFDILKGSRVLVNVWAIGRDPKVWTKPEKFIPERFIGSNNIDLRGHDFQLLPFGSGRRSCPGLQLGLTVVRLVLAQLVHCFDWELPNGMMPNDLDLTEKFGLVTARAQHLMAIPTYRLHI